jgi:hypothetical protein
MHQTSESIATELNQFIKCNLPVFRYFDGRAFFNEMEQRNTETF